MAKVDQSLRALVSDLSSRIDFFADIFKHQSAQTQQSQTVYRTGLTFRGRRDLYQSLGYPRTLQPQDYREEYERGGLAERIVETFPRATWSGGLSIVENPDPNVNTPFEEDILALDDRLKIWSKLMRLDILAGLGRYAVLLIGAAGGDDLSTELPRMNGPEDVIYLTPIWERNATILSFVTDPRDERFGRPEYYNLTLGPQVVRRTHWTRVIHFAENLLDDEVFGKPRLRSCWNYLMDLAKILGAGAEAAWNRMDPGKQIDIDPEIQLGNLEQIQLEDQIAEYDHGLRRTLQTRGAKVNVLSSQVDKYDANANMQLKLISGTTGIPQRLLTGSERGEVASTQDRNNFNDRTSERRREIAIPATAEFINRLVTYGAVRAPVDIWEAVWPEIDELSELEKAHAIQSIATANYNQAQAGGGLIISTDEIRNNYADMGPIDDNVQNTDSGTIAAASSGRLSAMSRGRYNLRNRKIELRANRSTKSRRERLMV